DHLLGPHGDKLLGLGQEPPQRLRVRPGAERLLRALPLVLQLQRVRYAMSYAFFGVQIVFQTPPGDPLKAQLHQVIREAPADQSLHEKRAFYHRLIPIVASALSKADRGYWDLIRGEKAESEYETWCSEIEGTLAQTPPEGGPYRSDASQYSLATALFLIEGG